MDPYGFQEEPAQPAAPLAGDVDTNAVVGMWLGIAAALCAAVGPCACYVPYLVALPLGAYGAFSASKALNSPDAGSRSMATGGLVSGLFAVVLGLVFLLGATAYALFLAYTIYGISNS